MIVGVDLAKKVFQVCYRIPGTKKIINHQLTRAKFREFLMDPNMPSVGNYIFDPIATKQSDRFFTCKMR